MTAEGAPLAARCFTTFIRAVRTWAAQSGEELITASRRWLTLRLEAPGAESPGKECRACRMEESLMLEGEGVGSKGTAGVGLRIFDQHILENLGGGGLKKAL